MNNNAETRQSAIQRVINRLFKTKCPNCGSKNTNKMYAYNGPDFTCGYDVEYTCKDCNTSWIR